MKFVGLTAEQVDLVDSGAPPLVSVSFGDSPNLTMYNIRFGHQNDSDKVERYTICGVWRHTPESIETFWGLADCNPTDNFCYESGRKLAMSRALETVDREHRRAIWKAYHNRRNTIRRAVRRQSFMQRIEDWFMGV